MFGFLVPLFLAGAAAVAVPVVLHLLKREPAAPVTFAALRLLPASTAEQTARRRLRELLLLAARAAALVLLSLAFARPFLAAGSAAGRGGALVVVLDTSLSMSDASRMDTARELASRAIADAAPGERVAVVTFADAAEIAAPLSADRDPALAAVAAATPGYGATSYRAGLTAAAELVAGHAGTSRIVIVTDLQAAGWRRDDRVTLGDEVVLDIADVGPAGPNLAVIDARAGADGQVTATVRSAAPAEREVTVALVTGGGRVDEAAVVLAPGQSAAVALEAPPDASWAEIVLDDPGGIAADNSRFLLLDTGRAAPVLVVGASGDVNRDAFFLRHALLASGPAGTLFRVEGLAAEALSGWTAERLSEYAVVVLVSTRGLDARGRERLAEFLDHDGRLLAATGPELDAAVAADALGGRLAIELSDAATSADRVRRVTPEDVRHPVFRRLGWGTQSLGLVGFERVASLTGGPDCLPLARFTTGEAALLECAGNGRLVVFASDLNQAWNDFPRHATFVPFVHELLHYLAAGRPRAGEYLVGDAPPGVAARPGVVTRPGDSAWAPGRLVAINIDPAETDAARLSPAEFSAPIARWTQAPAPDAHVTAVELEAAQQAWRFLLIAAMIVLAAESLLARRTPGWWRR